jgi:hypothetical protein
MKRATPFPSLALSLPDDIEEDNDSTVASYWKQNDSCLLQISSFRRDRGPQVCSDAAFDGTDASPGDWKTITLTRAIEGCDIAAASIKDEQNTSWVHAHLVWEWLAVHATISTKDQRGLRLGLGLSL